MRLFFNLLKRIFIGGWGLAMTAISVAFWLGFRYARLRRRVKKVVQAA